LPWAVEHTIKNQLVDLLSIHTIPASGDPFGQLTGGDLQLKAKFFALPDFKALAGTERADMPAYAFSLDDCGDDFLDEYTFFVPFVESSTFLDNEELTICGLLLQEKGVEMGRQRTFQRVGFAVISHVNGSVAGTGYRVENWKPPPWSEEELQHVIIL
jgi:hypothetical protein